MKKIFITSVFCLFITTILIGQTSKTYSVNIGKYKCSPTFYENKDNSDGLLSASNEGELVSNPPLYFPKRTDTLYYQTPDKKTTKKPKTIDHYLFECGEDTIITNEIDSLINGQINVSSDKKNLKLVGYVLNVTYSDGERTSLVMTNKTISKDSKALQLFKKSKAILYVGLSDIEFYNSKQQKLTIGEGYGWRILNSQ